MSAIEINNATVSFSEKDALYSFSWRVNRGERWFILGVNGAGKTTLVKLILGLVWTKFGGEVRVLDCLYGRDNLLEIRAKIAWVSPFMNQWISSGNEALTVLQVVLTGANATFDCYQKEFSPAEIARAEQTLAMLNAADLRDKLFAKCSSGEQVKTLIARTMMTNPELLILDETCVHLDLPSREILLNGIDRLAAQSPNLTILMITHRLEEITGAFTHGLILQNGKITAQGEREAVLTEDNLRRAFGIDLRLIAGANGRKFPIISSC